MVNCSNRASILANKLKKLKEENKKDDVIDYSKLKAPMFEHFHWHRLVMDEAHEIFGQMLQNKSQNQYICDWILRLNYVNRWFVSGTPFVNKFGYNSCLKFLEHQCFYKDILVDTNTRSNILSEVFENYVISQILENIVLGI